MADYSRLRHSSEGGMTTLTGLPKSPESRHSHSRWHVSKVPLLDSCTAANKAHRLVYSITVSARANSLSGIVRPSALAVVRLMTRSNSFGCSIGRSAGLDPRNILSTRLAARRHMLGQFAP